jgi:putative membrane protein
MRVLLTVIINAVAIWVATWLLPGMNVTSQGGMTQVVLTYLAIGVVFGVVNAIVRPIVSFLSIPFYILTLGLFTFVVNALMLWLTARLSSALGLGFEVDDFFWTAVFGAIIISVVAMIGHSLVPARSRELR